MSVTQIFDLTNYKTVVTEFSFDPASTEGNNKYFLLNDSIAEGESLDYQRQSDKILIKAVSIKDRYELISPTDINIREIVYSYVRDLSGYVTQPNYLKIVDGNDAGQPTGLGVSIGGGDVGEIPNTSVLDRKFVDGSPGMKLIIFPNDGIPVSYFGSGPLDIENGTLWLGWYSNNSEDPEDAEVDIAATVYFKDQ